MKDKYLDKIIADYEEITPAFSELKQAFKEGRTERYGFLNFKERLFKKELETSMAKEQDRNNSLDKMKVRGHIELLLTDELKHAETRYCFPFEDESLNFGKPGDITKEKKLYIKQAMFEAHTSGMLKSSLTIQKKIGDAILQTGDKEDKKYLVNFLKDELV